MTTNIDVNKLDPALRRSGRVDYQIEFNPVDRVQAEKLFMHFYEKKDKNHSKLRELAKSFSMLDHKAVSNLKRA